MARQPGKASGPALPALSPQNRPGRCTTSPPAVAVSTAIRTRWGNHVFWDKSQLDMLRRCLKLDVDVRRQGDGVVVQVRLSARGVGHRVPTGFIDRQLLLVVDGQDGAGRDVPLKAGSTLPAAVGPALAGRPGRLYVRRLKDETGALAGAVLACPARPG